MKPALLWTYRPTGNMLGVLFFGDEVGIYEISTTDKKRVALLPGVETFEARFSPDGKSFLYAVASRAEVTFYRQAWSKGKLIGKPQIALKFPFSFSLVAMLSRPFHRGGLSQRVSPIRT